MDARPQKTQRRRQARVADAQDSGPSSPAWPADRVERWPIQRLLAYPQNPMQHSEASIRQIAASIVEFGWTMPVLVDEDGVIIAGHARLLAAQLLKLSEVPVMRASGWTEAQKRAYRIADNELPRHAEWSPELLKLELTDLKLEGYDLALTGFDPDQLVVFMTGGAPPPSAEETPEPLPEPVSRRGDLWKLGRHRVLCGDATSAHDVETLLRNSVPDIANCDPPYGISIVKGAAVGGSKPFGSQGRVHGLGKAGFGRVHGNAAKAIIQTNLYAPVIGDDGPETAIAGYQMLQNVGVPVIVMWGGNYYANALPPSRCWLVWDKQVTGTFADVELAWTNCDQVARLFQHEWNGLMKASERGERRVHPTQKPVALAGWVIETLAPKATSALDLFLGSGATLIACERKGIVCYGMEIAPDYVDVAVRRWEKFSGERAELDGKRGFDAVAEARGVKTEPVG